MVTGKVDKGGAVDDSKDTLVPYEINEQTHELITAAANNTRALLSKPAVVGGGR